MATNWRGVMVDARTAAMMDEVDRLCGSTSVQPSQGSYSGSVGASAGTHSGGGAIDIKAANLSSSERTQVETAMRQVGFAAWVRSPDQGDWGWHIHGIAVGCPDLSGPARDQVDDYNAGRNGLANNGPDTGTRAYVGVTWETYSGGSAPGGWLIEGVLPMSAIVVTFFNYKGSVYEADLLAGTYRRIPDPGTLTDRKSMLDRQGIPWNAWDDNDVKNPAAFGVSVG